MNEEEKNAYLSYLNGENAREEAPPQLINSARNYLQNNRLPQQVSDITLEQSLAFSFLHNEFIKSNPVITNHVCWHDAFGSGGAQGPTSGEKFLLFHRQMIGDLKNYFRSSDLAIWGSNSSTAGEVADIFPLAHGATVNPMLLDSKIVAPSYLTVDGGNDSFALDGREIKSLSDIQSVDELGRVIGESGFHGLGHVLIGGTMASFESPRNPQFYAWHGEVDSIIDQWRNNTEAGQNWFKSSSANGWQSALDRSAEAYANNYNFTTFCNATNLPSNPPTLAPSRAIQNATNLPSNPPTLAPSRAIQDGSHNILNTETISLAAGVIAMIAAISVLAYCARKKLTNAARIGAYQEVNNPPPPPATGSSPRPVADGASQIIHGDEESLGREGR